MVLSSHASSGSVKIEIPNTVAQYIQHLHAFLCATMFFPSYILRVFEKEEIESIPTRILSLYASLSEHFDEVNDYAAQLKEELEAFQEARQKATEPPPPPAEVLPVIRARAFELVGSDGKIGATLEFSKPYKTGGGQIPEQPQLIFHSKEGLPLMSMGLWADDGDGIKELPIFSMNTMASNGGLLDISGNRDGGLSVQIFEKDRITIDQAGQIIHHQNEHS